MAKRKKTAKQSIQPENTRKKKEPKFTHLGFQISVGAIIVGFLVQVAMAVIVYPQLPSRISAAWAGSSVPYNTIPSWLVFILFPGAQIVMLALSWFSPKDDKGRRLMENGNAVFLVLLSLLFTSLQYSAFRIGHGSLL
jgi:uncharacterized membrane protein